MGSKFVDLLLIHTDLQVFCELKDQALSSSIVTLTVEPAAPTVMVPQGSAVGVAISPSKPVLFEDLVLHLQV